MLWLGLWHHLLGYVEAMSIRRELQTLKETDMWGLILFVLYKLKDSKEYSAISELAYVLDKKNMLKLCEYFGGCTIKIPTIQEIEEIVYGLLLYDYVEIDKMNIEDALDKINTKDVSRIDIKKSYLKIKDTLNEYEFTSRSRV